MSLKEVGLIEERLLSGQSEKLKEFKKVWLAEKGRLLETHSLFLDIRI